MKHTPTPTSPINNTSNYLNESKATAEQRAALRELTDELRQLTNLCCTLNADEQTLVSLASEIRTARLRAEEHSEHRLLEFFRTSVVDDPTDGMQPYSPVGGSHNAVTPPINYRKIDERIIGEVMYGLAHEGPARCVHGGILSAVFDQLMGITCVTFGRPGFTANLDVKYRLPTPLERKLEFHAWIEKIDGKKTFVHAECVAEGASQIFCEAQGLFIYTNPDEITG